MIEIWSKPNCPFCDKAENLCVQKNLDFKKYMLDVDFTREEFIAEFGEGSTFPQVSCDGKKLGGSIETVKFLKEQQRVA